MLDDQSLAKPEKPGRKFSPLLLIPLIFILILGSLFVERLLYGDAQNKIPSNLIAKPAPKLTLPALEDSGLPGVTPKTLDGKVSVVNIWASWCVPCRQEHPILMELADNQAIQIIGINMRDQPQNARKFLNQLGNPYDVVGVDPNGRAAVEWGGYGVPETFIVDQAGIIRFKHIGPISPVILQDQIQPLLAVLLQN